LQARYDHYMTRAAGGKFPSLAVCVDCESFVTPKRGKLAPERDELKSWYATILSLESLSYGCISVAMGSTSESWWRLLAEVSTNYGACWIVSVQCARIWSLLTLWQRLEDGSISLTRKDERHENRANLRVMRQAMDSNTRRNRTSSGAVSKLRRLGEGYLALEDPPNIAVFSVNGASRQYTWIDIRNYGVSLPNSVSHGRDGGQWIARWFSEYAKLVVDAKLGSLQTTVGAQSMHGFRASYLNTGIYCHADNRGIAIESGAYFGGHCESFTIGVRRSNCWHVDFRSLYPAIYCGSRLPVRFAGYIDLPGEKEAIALTVSERAIAEVTIETDEADYPYRVRTGDAAGIPKFGRTSQTFAAVHGADVIYPVGRFTTTLAGPELLDALQHGRIKQWHKLAYYEVDYALQSFGRSIYPMRDQIQDSCAGQIESVVKQILVSLPGKMGQRQRFWDRCESEWSDVAWGEWWGRDLAGNPCKYRSIAHTVYRDTVGGFAKDAVPAIAAWITSAGRMKLLEAMRTAGRSEVLYVDTDGLIVTEAGYRKLCAANMVRIKELGFLDTKAGPVTVEIKGIKHYVSNGKVTCSGLPKGHCVDAEDGEHYWYHSTPGSFIAGNQVPVAERRLIRYARNGQYRHGVVNSDGTVSPLEVWE
jgi:hypothetical protein